MSWDKHETTLTKRLSEQEGEQIMCKDNCVLLSMGIIYMVSIIWESYAHKNGETGRANALIALGWIQSDLFTKASTFCIIALKLLPQSVGN